MSKAQNNVSLDRWRELNCAFRVAEEGGHASRVSPNPTCNILPPDSWTSRNYIMTTVWTTTELHMANLLWKSCTPRDQAIFTPHSSEYRFPKLLCHRHHLQPTWLMTKEKTASRKIPLHRGPSNRVVQIKSLMSRSFGCRSSTMSNTSTCRPTVHLSCIRSEASTPIW